jgi:hypothetical protein
MPTLWRSAIMAAELATSLRWTGPGAVAIDPHDLVVN